MGSANTKSQNSNQSDKIRPLPIKSPSLASCDDFCYLNSALQGISSCDKFVKDIEKIYKENNDLEKLFVFHQLIFILNGGKMDIKEISRNQIFREWNKLGQQDSFDLITYVINQVYNEIRQSKEKAGIIPKRDMQAWLKIPLPMRIIIEYKIRCDCDSIVDVPLQSDLALHVSISLKDDFDLQTLVNQFFNEDRIEDYECGTEGCNGTGAIRYTRLRDPLPRTICIHLQRTFWNGNKMTKIDKRIKFSKLLEIKCEYRTFDNIKALHVTNKITNEFSKVNIDKTNSYAVSNDCSDTSFTFNLFVNDEKTLKNNTDILAQNYSISKEIETFTEKVTAEEATADVHLVSPRVNNNTVVSLSKANKNNNSEIAAEIVHDSLRDKPESSIDDVVIEKDETYHLTSVIVHYSSVYGGHCVCYKYLDGRWFLTNDSQIEEVSEQNVLNCNPYILFYEQS